MDNYIDEAIKYLDGGSYIYYDKFKIFKLINVNNLDMDTYVIKTPYLLKINNPRVEVFWDMLVCHYEEFCIIVKKYLRDERRIRN